MWLKILGIAKKLGKSIWWAFRLFCRILSYMNGFDVLEAAIQAGYQYLKKYFPEFEFFDFSFV